MKLSPTLLALVALSGCHPTLTRPDQENLTLHAGSGGIRRFVAALEHHFGISAEVQDLHFADSDPAQMFTLNGNEITIVVNPVPDERCNPNAPMHATYRSGEYRIDLIYETKAAAKRQSAKDILATSAKEAGQQLIPFREC